MTNMTDILQVADKAAAASDRWLLVFMALIFFSTVVFFWRWFSNEYNQLRKRLDAVVDLYLTDQEKRFMEVIQENTRISQTTAELLKQVSENMVWCQKNNP